MSPPDFMLQNYAMLRQGIDVFMWRHNQESLIYEEEAQYHTELNKALFEIRQW
ncbi:MAG: hypothetical protein MK193_13000 [Lentisphaeria bacterium]|nr:hypothetical protein [Lentisphaeria bacterium]